MERQFTLAAGGRPVDIPCFFPAISSVKTNLTPLEYLRVLTGVKHPQLLISAYDLCHSTVEERNEIKGLLMRCHREGILVMLDSGNYERYWRDDRSWTRNDFHSVLDDLLVPLAFSFDNQERTDDINAVINEVEKSVLEDQLNARCTILPIVHCYKDALPEAVAEVAHRLHPIMIAVPERLLGEGIVDRARTAIKIREALKQLDYYCPLHLLGTGNPVSILVYALCGADSFDGLEWCQTVVDHRSAFLFHFQHWDFVASETPVGQLKELPYSQRVLVHNLLFYTRWLTEIRDALRQGNRSQLLSDHFPPDWIRILPSDLQELV